ncbi:MAG: SGNH/GDSL hydrolase family protein [Parabacteroides sp.]|uniref:SGNH/GDSL hydrolase family protein n=2 Tax=Parabacteroides faecalis TaxID=2924040 RepID=A0ABT0C503_9BACT|nr:SGNH/GDSL hydrolase family protein [Parabacteroides faecalis]MCI7286730.1 SGNH/GDSL hydrolase family protein [Parabacteroides sp.]MCJ2382082.1 SGNH/GDSL hydrolase family protein [Parabacteroides faecalis]MDD7562962.1 SGNH/GDSL hydrolase family protein [Parabacteroides sp.]MDY6255416.1 SGNH/GDSL hydrolase family protein [Bacteroidales bacterium]
MQVVAQEPLKDWANFGRYKEANAAVQQPVKAVFMGNSITDGWPAADPDFFTKNGYVGRGIGGQVSAQMLMRFRQDVINLKPQAVVILAGTNDLAHNDYAVTPEQTFDNVVSMVQLAQANGIKVILCSTLPAYQFGWRPELKPAEDIKAFNKKVKAYADAHDILYVDYHSAMKDERDGLPEKYSKDGVHPTLEGYKVMEKLVQEALQKVVK